MPTPSLVQGSEWARPEVIRSFLVKSGVAEAQIKTWLEPLSESALRFDIVNRLRVIHWLATLIHESAGFTQLEENLNYSAIQLLRLFPLTPHRPWGFEPQEAADYARQPEKIADRIYGGRLGNGPESSGEGWFYRGRGPIQITGRDNYKAASPVCGVDLVTNPELLTHPEYGALAAGDFWKRHACNTLADLDDVVAIRRHINGGDIGLKEVSLLVSKMKFA